MLIFFSLMLIFFSFVRNAPTAHRKTSKDSIFFCQAQFENVAHASPLLTKLHWLPIAQRIESKVSSKSYDVVSETAPPYLSDLLHLYIPSRSLRSSDDIRTFRIPKRKKCQGQHTFPHLGPVIWNELPYSVTHAAAKSRFKIQLKTTLFLSAHGPNS